MGSLVFIGRSLEDTPYADLALPTSFASVSSSSEGNCQQKPEDVHMSDEGCSLSSVSTASTSTASTSSSGTTSKPKTDSCSALNEAANLFRARCCHQLNLSDIDPLLTAFSSGCRVLTRLHSLQRAIACL
ncbi:unnamed protein product, partial [Trichobilharzia regenti]